MTTRPRALIVSPYTPQVGFIDTAPLRKTVHDTRMYNLKEYLSASEKGWESTGDLNDRTGIKLLILVGRKGCSARDLADRVKADLAFHKDAHREYLDWNDIDEFEVSSSPIALEELASSLSWPPSTWRLLAETQTSGATALRDQIAELALDLAGVELDFDRKDIDQQRPHGRSRGRRVADRSGAVTPSAAQPSLAKQLPVEVSAHGQSLVVGMLSSRLRADSISLMQADIDGYDTSGSWAVSSDGHVAVSLHEGTVSTLWLTAAGKILATTPGWTVNLPEAIGEEPRILAVSIIRGDTVRLIVATSSGTYRVFLRNDRPVSVRPIEEGSPGAALVMQVGTDTVTTDKTGRLQGHNSTPVFTNITQVCSMDGAISGRIGLAVAAGTAGRNATVVASRSMNSRDWIEVDLSRLMTEHKINPSKVVAVGVERCLDGRPPSRIYLAMLGEPDAKLLDVSSADRGEP